MKITFRPIDAWPGPRTANPRRSSFSATWSATLEQLQRELDALDAHSIVAQLALHEREIKLDGWPRATARPEHPGVILAFDSRYGPLKYATDTFTVWTDNFRAIALGLEALRKVDRYGVTKRGEQYTGWRQLETGGASVARGQDLIRDHGSVTAALKASHPDHGGNQADFEAVQAARSA